MNKNIWNLYKNSERGKNVIELFTFDRDKDSLEEKVARIFDHYSEYLSGEVAKDYFIDNCFIVIESITVQKLFMTDDDSTDSYFKRLIENLQLLEVILNEQGEITGINDEVAPYVKKGDYKALCANIPAISLILYFYGTGEYIPNLYRERFDVLLRTLDILEISVPELPSKADKKGRLLLYNQINNNILSFAKEYKLSPSETCACIYDFSKVLLENTDKGTENLPVPTNIWLTGASKEDYKEFLEHPKKYANSVWTCNERTKRGDIIIMYVLSPYSCLQSIWRAEVDGVYTPFNYYNSRTRAMDGIIIPHISLNELKTHLYFSTLPIVKRNFQGVSGIQLSAKDYDELQILLRAKGFDTATLPQLYSPDLEIVKGLRLEKDVEEKLLIPLLAELGYSEDDWTRQLSQKAGRFEKAIPDFVFLPKGETHFQNAPMLIEAKFDMSSNIERMKAYDQALSYARMMRSSIFGICDKERLVIFKQERDHFSRFDPTFEKHWPAINDKDTFRELKLLIGKQTIEKI